MNPLVVFASVACGGFLWGLLPGPAATMRSSSMGRHPRRWPHTALCLVLGAGAALVHPVMGLLVALLAWWWLGHSSERPQQSGEGHDLAHVVALMVGPLRAGAAPATALRQATEALPGPAAQRLAEPLALLGVGVDPDTVWRQVASDPVTGELGRALLRAQRSGAAIGPTVERLAAELAEASAAALEDRARTVGVRAAVPLGLCLLPAFLLVGVVPLAVGLFGTVLR